MTRRFLTLATIVAAMGAMAVGCGGDDSSDSSAPAAGDGTGAADTSGDRDGGESGADADADGDGGGSIATSSLDKSQFVKRANALCNKERKGLVQEARSYFAERSSDGLPPRVLTAKIVKELAMPVVEAQIEAVRGLGAPEGDEEEIEAMLDAQQRAVDEVKEQKEIDPVNGPVKQFKDVTETYERYGLKWCSYAV